MMGIAISKESSLGVSEVTAGVNILDFFQSQILPELRDSNHASRPVLKATALKFVSVFRKQFTREDLVQLFPLLILHLGSPVVVVHTFAAYTIERLLFTKDEVVGGPSVYKIPSSDIRPFVEPLFTALFAIVDNLEHNENDNVMKCVMRALIRVGEDILPVTEIVLSKLTAALGRVAANPRNPQFNHYLFESISVLVRSVCSKNASGGDTLESMLFEPFTVILQMDIAEFTPYVFQVLAQLLEYRPPGTGLSPAYQSLFPPLLTPALWEKRGNVPALARLIQAYICKAAPELVPHLNPILGVFQKLISVKATEASSFEILNSVVLHFPKEALEPALPTIFSLLFTRLQASKTTRYTQLVTTFFALFVGKYGAQVFLDRTNVIQPGVGVMVILHVWAPRLKTDPPAHRMEAKVQVVGVTSLLCESVVLLSDVNGPKAWVEALAGVITLLTSPTYQNTAATRIAGDELEFETGYDAQFSRLVHAAKVSEDPFPEVADPGAHFVQSLHKALLANSSHLVPLIQHGLSEQPKPIKDGLDFMFQQAGFTLG
jgi:exportin-2 (importin alpha re-exporter)